MTELEQTQPKFRKGESPQKPYGGKVSSEPFPKALYELVRSRGYESQLGLAKALGRRNNSLVANWFLGIRVPTPEYMGMILILCQPNNEELDKVIDPYAELIAVDRGNKAPVKGSQRALATSRSRMKSVDQPWNKWVENFCQQNNVTLDFMAKKLTLYSGRSMRKTSGLEQFYEILGRAPQALNLDSELYQSLVEAIAQTIEQKFAAGYKLRSGRMGLRVVSLQREVVCKTYTRTQVANELGVSRQAISFTANGNNWPVLLTEDHLQALKDKHAAYLARRKS